ncbi:type II toxin-antitoxin system VapC family toxin [Spirulina sp. 06S082]|uniref:type II toxin-antitoxin system VapC family toxin n=1 Tax=Spirulina sp. 06S082 TaxID=3110248 RepID=UPI002B1FE8B6|nr:PIN domain-containing protein [Spirulina sp. 06S082]MEA5468335.1 PIN domain-containing protein [Spirulina sp. 06S082]
MTICDASALIALINRGDRNHQRCIDVLPYLSSPLITTWSCVTEAMYLLARYGGWAGQQELWNYFVDGILILHQHDLEERERMQFLMEQYRDIPMDLGDASLVVTAETLNQRQIFTLDRDFYIYRFRGDLSFEVFP